ncbi:hypothetical protein ACFLYL_00260 [Chloroflexota bacterium]
MPDYESSIEKRPEGAPANQELNPWLRKRLSEHESRFILRRASPASTLSLSREGGHQLSRRLMANSWVASVISRATRLPVLSRAFDGIINRGTSTLTRVWPQSLDLPWVRNSRQYGRQSSETGDAPDIDAPTAHLRNDFFRAPSQTDTGRPANKMTETHPVDTREQPSPLVSAPALSKSADRIPLAKPGRVLTGRIQGVDGITHIPDRSPGLGSNLQKSAKSPADGAFPPSANDEFSRRASRGASGMKPLGNSDKSRVDIRNTPPRVSDEVGSERLAGKAADTSPFDTRTQFIPLVSVPALSKSAETIPLLSHQKVVPARTGDAIPQKPAGSPAGRAYPGVVNHGLSRQVSRKASSIKPPNVSKAESLPVALGQKTAAPAAPRMDVFGLSRGDYRGMITPEGNRAEENIGIHIQSTGKGEHNIDRKPQDISPETKISHPFTPIAREIAGQSMPAGETSPTRDAPGRESPLPLNKPDMVDSRSLHVRKTRQVPSSGVVLNESAIPLMSEPIQTQTAVPAVRRTAKPELAPAPNQIITEHEKIAGAVIRQGTDGRSMPGEISQYREGGKAYTAGKLSSRKPLPVFNQIVQPLPRSDIVSRTADLPLPELASKELSRIQNSHYARSPESEPAPNVVTPDIKPSVALPLRPRVLPNQGIGAARDEKLFRYAADAIPSVVYPAGQSGIDMALAPQTRIPDIQRLPQTVEQTPPGTYAPSSLPVPSVQSASSSTSPAILQMQAERAASSEIARSASEEPPGEGKNADGRKPDLGTLARELYPLLRKMIMIERERQPGR